MTYISLVEFMIKLMKLIQQPAAADFISFRLTTAVNTNSSIPLLIVYLHPSISSVLGIFNIFHSHKRHKRYSHISIYILRDNKYVAILLLNSSGTIMVQYNNKFKPNHAAIEDHNHSSLSSMAPVSTLDEPVMETIMRDE